MLDTLGLAADAEALYRTMVTRPAWTIPEITAQLDMSDMRIRVALDRLAEMKLVHASWQDPHRLVPVSPSVGLRLLLASAESDVDRHREKLEQTRAAVAALVEAQDAARTREGVVRLEGLDALHGRITELAALARTEMSVLKPGGGNHPGGVDATRHLDEKILRRGLLLRSVFQESVRGHSASFGYVRSLARLGAQTRTVPAVPQMMFTFDDQVALVPLDPSDPSEGALEMRSPGAVATARALFEQVWVSATPIEQTSRRCGGRPIPLERVLLELLAEGHTDQTAARRLDCSLRTVRRMMAQIMAELNARSRFQAGLRVAENGWLTPVDEVFE
ncbi:hypothetical protein Sar04_03790 [Salinispora arenicola]|uniref:Regulatory LuxR family protein n=3 Tax=Salinispora arenicola TaxID=168697 RepID=A0A542XIN8_SALAC|nr:regulatory LuxR family protein [Salinispora arenicola]GIM81755.1 hypothetical protein Sar04_03790 [Salinispora arenicola]